MHATFIERKDVGGGLLHFVLEPEKELIATHDRHGQYVEVRHHGSQGDGDPESTIGAATRGYFALASTPGAARWELVFKDVGAMADRLRGLAVGDEVVVSAAQGAGFPVEEAAGAPLLLAVTGSGIAAVLSTARARVEAREATHTYLFHGIRDGVERTLAREYAQLRDAGVEVVVCLSREDARFPGEERGYLQDVAVRRGLRLARGFAFAAGNPRMIAGLREHLPELGLSPERLLVNH